MLPDKKEQPTPPALADLTLIISPKATTALHTITVQPLCAACGQAIDRYQSLCADCTSELMNQPPSWTASRL